MKLRLYIILIGIVLGLGSCGDGKPVRQLPHLGNTPYQQDSILVTYATNPDRALTLLDSALLLGNISEYRGQFIRAKIYCKSLEELRLDSAIIICQALLTHDSVRNEPTEQENILDLLIATARAKHDNEAYLRWATQKAELCQQQGLENERWRTEADIGYVMTSLGQVDEGLQKLDEAIGHLDSPGSIDRMDAFIVACKRKINALSDLHRFDEVITLGQRILDRLDHYEQHANDYAEDSYRLSWSDNPSDRDRYLDFSRAQAWGFLAHAYAMLSEKLKVKSEKEKAKECLALFDQTDYGKTFAARRMIAPAQMALGMYDEALATYDEVEHRMAGDTLNEDYAVILRSRAIAARDKGRIVEALDYQTRYANLSKAVSDSLHRSEAHDYAARYHAQEQQLEIQEKEAEAQRSHIINIALAAGLLIVLVAALYIFYQKRIVNEKNRGLVRLIDEAIEYKERFVQLQNAIRRPSPENPSSAPAELKTLSDGELFLHLCDDIRENKLYLDPMFDRQAVCNRYNLSVAQVGSAFAQGSDYSSVADFIRDCRLEHACILLKTTDMKVTNVAAASGFSRATTFNHDFKTRFNLSPTEYRRQ